MFYKRSFSLRSTSRTVLITIFLAGLVAIPTSATGATSYSCPSGGGMYVVDAGAVTGTTGDCRGDLILNNSVRRINNYAFGNSLLTSLTIPAAVTTITGSPFADFGNSLLESITVNSANPNYSSEDGVLFDKNKTVLITYPSQKPGSSYVIPPSVTSLRTYSFVNNQNLTAINIPDGVTSADGGIFSSAVSLTLVNIGTGLSSLGEQAFMYINALTAINVDSGNNHFSSISGVLFDKNITTLWAYPIGKTDEVYVVPNTVTSTRNTVFGGSPYLKTVDLSSVTTLSGQEFSIATSLEVVTFGDGLATLPGGTLQGASNLKRVNFGTGLTLIEDYAFYGNTLFEKFYYCGTNSTILNYGFPNSVKPTCGTTLDIEAISREAALQRETIKRQARLELSMVPPTNISVTVELFNLAGIPGVNKGNIADVISDLANLSNQRRSDIDEVIRIARKYEVVGKIATGQIFTSGMLQEIGLIGPNSKNKSILTYTIRKLPAEDRSSYSQIQAALVRAGVIIQERLDRVSKMRSRTISRSTILNSR